MPMYGLTTVNPRTMIRPMNAATQHPSPDDMRAIYSAASQYLRMLYADQPSPHATKDNCVRLARIAESLHAGVKS